MTNLVSDQQVRSLKLTDYKRHIFICAGPKCCREEEGASLWDYVKDKLREKGLASPGGNGEVFRTKVHCLRVCADGPIAVVYPEGVWYRLLDEKAIDEIIEKHLVSGEVVEHLVLCRNLEFESEKK